MVVELNGKAGGDRFDGIGAVSGGGATSVLLKDYPPEQRSQILDLMFKPKFGASISALYVELGGDGNSTQGSEPSHMHSRSDENYFRGYEWWLMKEAKKRNPSISLDGCAWACPAWIGHGTFFSQDMADYYAKWIKGLQTFHGMTMDAIGCRNEKGVNEDFIKLFRKTLDANGLQAVKIHGFDNWGKEKWNWTKDLETDPELVKAVGAISNHTLTDVGTPDSVKALAKKLGKPIWNSEEHVYLPGFDCAISIVQAFNQNYYRDGATKVLNWYLAGGVYDVEPYPVEPSMLVANSPWSGSYKVREALWGYAHYGQFCKIGWEYLHGGSGTLPGGGSFVTLMSPSKSRAGFDYSVISETKGAKAPQTITFKVEGGLSPRSLCVWRSNAKEQFVRLADIVPTNGAFSLTLEPDSIYSLSTTRGQQKGAFKVPENKPFPFPYFETFDHYADGQAFGYLPHYTADIDGVFEIADRPEHDGKCLKQILPLRAQSWAPEWTPYTVFGDSSWTDYEVSADVALEKRGWAGVMGRVSSTGDGWNGIPHGYYLSISDSGEVKLTVSIPYKQPTEGKLLATGFIAPVKPRSWHNVKLQFQGRHLVGLVDGKEVVSVENDECSKGVAGLITGDFDVSYNVAYFDNLIVNAVNGPKPTPTLFRQDRTPIYPH